MESHAGMRGIGSTKHLVRRAERRRRRWPPIRSQPAPRCGNRGAAPANEDGCPSGDPQQVSDVNSKRPRRHGSIWLRLKTAS
jgi:hypothetical protein